MIKDSDNVKLLTEFKNICSKYKGLQEVVMVLEDNGKKQALKMPFKVEFDQELLSELKNLLSDDCVKIK